MIVTTNGTRQTGPARLRGLVRMPLVQHKGRRHRAHRLLLRYLCLRQGSSAAKAQGAIRRVEIDPLRQVPVRVMNDFNNTLANQILRIGQPASPFNRCVISCGPCAHEYQPPTFSFTVSSKNGSIHITIVLRFNLVPIDVLEDIFYISPFR